MKMITVKAQVEVPRVPNFLVTNPNHKISIADVPDDELRYVGEAWTENLLARAADIRVQEANQAVNDD